MPSPDVRFAADAEYFLSPTYKGSSTRAPFRIVIDPAELNRIRRNLMAVRSLFVDALPQVRPEFGAYMFYSVFQELGAPRRNQPARPHIYPAIEQHRGYIVRELGAGVMQLGNEYITRNNRPSVAMVVKNLERLWERILNGPPRATAQANAPVEFGFHRYTIRGYGKERAESDVRKQMNDLARRREAVERYLRSGKQRKRSAGARDFNMLGRFRS